jgi:hypothetical protein
MPPLSGFAGTKGARAESPAAATVPEPDAPPQQAGVPVALEPHAPIPPAVQAATDFLGPTAGLARSEYTPTPMAASTTITKMRVRNCERGPGEEPQLQLPPAPLLPLAGPDCPGQHAPDGRSRSPDCIILSSPFP